MGFRREGWAPGGHSLLALWTPGTVRFGCGTRAGLSKAQEPQQGLMPGSESVPGSTSCSNLLGWVSPHAPGICLNKSNPGETGRLPGIQ